jgi:hypothetical protein
MHSPGPCREESDVPERSNAQASDARVFEAASRFFAALLGAGRVNETNQPGIIRYCIRAAQLLVQEADQAVQAAREPAPPVGAGDLDLELELEELAKGEGTAYRSRPPQRPPAGGRQGAPPSSL